MNKGLESLDNLYNTACQGVEQLDGLASQEHIRKDLNKLTKDKKAVESPLKALEIIKTIFKIELGISFANTSYTKYHLKLTNRLDNNHFIVINISKEHYDLLKKELEK